MYPARLVCLGVLIAASAAGCGGGSRASGSYTLNATESCLKHAGFQTAVVTNHYLPGSAGNLRVQFGNLANAPLTAGEIRDTSHPTQEDVFIVFDRSPAAALVTENKALNLTVRSLIANGILITRATVRNGVQVTRNVFYYSATGPLTKKERATVGGCLR